MTPEDLLILMDMYADEVLRDYINATAGGGLRARATLVIEITKLFEKLDAVKGNPCKEIEGVAV